MESDLSSARLATRDSDGFVEVQPDPYGSSGTLPSYEAFLHGGVMFRPKDPDPTTNLGCNILVNRHGGDGRVQIGHDPRWMSALPDFGDGGAALYATTELSGVKVTPFVGFFGEGGDAAEGTFRLSVPTSAGTTTIEVNASTGDVAITHPGGTTFTVKASGIEAGAAGGFAVVIDNGALAAWAAAVGAAITAAGGTAPPPLAGYTATKVKAT